MNDFVVYLLQKHLTNSFEFTLRQCSTTSNTPHFRNLLISDFEILRMGDTIVTLLTLVTVILWPVSTDSEEVQPTLSFQFWIPNDQGTCPTITVKTITILAKFIRTYKAMANDHSLDLKETSQYILFITNLPFQSEIEQNFRQSRIFGFF